MSECAHYFIPNNGRGGEAEFLKGARDVAKTLARCALCDARICFTEEEWNAIPVAKEPTRAER